VAHRIRIASFSWRNCSTTRVCIHIRHGAIELHHGSLASPRSAARCCTKKRWVSRRPVKITIRVVGARPSGPVRFGQAEQAAGTREVAAPITSRWASILSRGRCQRKLEGLAATLKPLEAVTHCFQRFLPWGWEQGSWPSSSLKQLARLALASLSGSLSSFSRGGNSAFLRIHWAWASTCRVSRSWTACCADRRSRPSETPHIQSFDVVLGVGLGFTAIAVGSSSS